MSGGEGGAPVTPDDPLCVDDDPCTLDASSDSGCSHEPAEDGTRAATVTSARSATAASAGTCTPTSTSTGPAAELGRVSGFGAGGVVAIGAGRYLFYDKYDLAPAAVTLVGVEGESTQVLDQLAIEDLNYVDTEHARVRGGGAR